MKNKITKEIEYMKYVLGYKRGVVISEQLTPEQKAKINTDQNNYASTFDREMASSTSNPPAASTSKPPVASTSTPPAASTSKPPVSSTPKTPDVPATLSAAEMTTLYNFAIGYIVKNSEIGDNTSLAAIAWLIWTRDLAKAPENKANIDLFIKNFPGAQDGVKMANIKISSAKKFSSLPEDLIKIGADYTGVNYSKERSDFGIGKSGKSGLSFNQASIAALPKLPSGTVINAEGTSPDYGFAKKFAILDYEQKIRKQPSTPSMDSIDSGEASSSFKNFRDEDDKNYIVRLTGKIN
jgi:hypothetical protein